KILADTDFPTTVKFLDAMKDLGYSNAFKGGLSFSLGDIVVPVEKKQMIADSIGTVSLNAKVRCRLPVKENGEIVTRLIETTVGRILFNQIV
ncbi:hypothetical protein MZ09_14520, partial [Staphylococcus aureus]